MARARAFIMAGGGIPRARVFTKIWLALFGTVGLEGHPGNAPRYAAAAQVGPPFNIYRFASWARATIVPMTIILTLHPTRPPRESAWIMELYPDGPVNVTLSRWHAKPFSLKGGFLVLDKAIRIYRHLPLIPGKKRAFKAAVDWIVSHQEADGSWAGIQPPWVYSLIALSALGFSLDHPVIAKGLEGFRGRWSLPSEDGKSLRVQACLSPVWDTCLAMRGLLDSGVPPDHTALQCAASWLIRNEIRQKGDWAVFKPHLEPSGWAFEFENIHYPDIDDTSLIVVDLAAASMGDEFGERARTAAIGRAVNWLTGMQCSNGGWAAFDWNNDSRRLADIPFARLWRTPGSTQRGRNGSRTGDVRPTGLSVGFPGGQSGPCLHLGTNKSMTGPWFGRWGVNYIYGTAAVLPALEALGVDMTLPRVRRAVDWLLARQNPDGGWGETCASYVNPSLRGQGESTPSQTSWALIALIAAGEVRHNAVGRGVDFLIERQRSDGTWGEPQFTGCGFPGYGPGDRPMNFAPLDDGQRTGARTGRSLHDQLSSLPQLFSPLGTWQIRAGNAMPEVVHHRRLTFSVWCIAAPSYARCRITAHHRRH